MCTRHVNGAGVLNSNFLVNYDFSDLAIRAMNYGNETQGGHNALFFIQYK